MAKQNITNPNKRLGRSKSFFATYWRDYVNR
jgi:hypothetical protein